MCCNSSVVKMHGFLIWKVLDISSGSSGWISHINFPISLLILFQALELPTSSLFSAQHSASLHAHLIKHRNCFFFFKLQKNTSTNSVKSNIQAHSTVMFIHSEHWNSNKLCMSLKIEASVFVLLKVSTKEYVPCQYLANVTAL